MSHILIDAAGSPVPLPFAAVDVDGDPCTVTDARMRGNDPMINLLFIEEVYSEGIINGWYHISLVRGLRLITEAEYMEKQS